METPIREVGISSSPAREGQGCGLARLEEFVIPSGSTW